MIHLLLVICLPISRTTGFPKMNWKHCVPSYLRIQDDNPNKVDIETIR